MTVAADQLDAALDVPATSERRAVVTVSPPVPAPYLADAPSLSNETLACISGQKRLMKPLEARITAELYSVAFELQQRREAWEKRHGVRIEPHTGSDRTTCPVGVF